MNKYFRIFWEQTNNFRTPAIAPFLRPASFHPCQLRPLPIWSSRYIVPLKFTDDQVRWGAQLNTIPTYFRRRWAMVAPMDEPAVFSCFLCRQTNSELVSVGQLRTTLTTRPLLSVFSSLLADQCPLPLVEMPVICLACSGLLDQVMD